MIFLKNQLLRTLRCRNRNVPGVLGKLTTLMGQEGVYVGEIKTVDISENYAVRDIDAIFDDQGQLDRLLLAIRSRLAEDVKVLEIRDEVLNLHRHGKIEVRTREPIKTINDLRSVYTPGVADVSRLIAEDPAKADTYTWMPLTVAICTNGSRVLGLGSIGPLASLPVMEGKAALLCQLTGLNAVPILIDTRDSGEFVETVLKIEKGFGAIHLEDIETPHCFEIEERLVETLNKPVMHDDQHGTAVAALAAVISACNRTDRDPKHLRIGQVGLGAAGIAIAQKIMAYTDNPVLATDVREDALRRLERAGGQTGTLDEVMKSCDLVVSTTGVPGLIRKEMIWKGQIILALSNPTPEITPEDALEGGALLAADGRSVNNLLGYPGIWRGVLDCRARRITTNMYTAAAEAIAELAPQDVLLPNPLDMRVHASVARAVARAASADGVAQAPVDKDYLAAEAAGLVSFEEFVSKERAER